MALVIRNIYNVLKRFDDEYKDPRTENMLLMGAPWKILGITLLYYVFIKKLGPAFMRDRQPYELKNFLLIYNLGQVAFNFYLAYVATYPLFNFKNYSDWSCMVADRTNSPEGLWEITLVHYYYMLKVVDYLDTIFFVLRKHNKQVTFLHVYHHITMGLLGWFVTRYIGGGHIFILGYMNVIVHGAMYFYYFMSALRPELRNSIWWKKYITQLQILQFLLLIVHFGRAVFNKNCGLKLLHAFGLTQAIFMFLMFSDFYNKAYLRKPKAKKIQKEVKEKL